MTNSPLNWNDVTGLSESSEMVGLAVLCKEKHIYAAIKYKNESDYQTPVLNSDREIHIIQFGVYKQ